MAIISFTNYKRGQTTGCMSAVMRYTMQDKKTEFEGQQLVTGINCQPESVYADFMTTKRLYHKTDGVLFYHMVQSFPKGEAVDPVTAHAAALKLAEYYEGYEVLVCTHTDLTAVQNSMAEIQKSLTEMTTLLEQAGKKKEKHSCKWLDWLPDFDLIVVAKWIVLVLLIVAALLGMGYGTATVVSNIRNLFL